MLPFGLSGTTLSTTDHLVYNYMNVIGVATIALLLLASRLFTTKLKTVIHAGPRSDDSLLLFYLCFFLQSVDEVSNQMEDPFELIPLYDIMATYERDINRQA